MITEDYVSFETAKLLKEKGFESDECIAIYDLGDNNTFIRDGGIFENGPEDYLEFQWGEEWRRFGYCLAPTIQMAMKWLREKHNITVIPGVRITGSIYGNKIECYWAGIWYVPKNNGGALCFTSPTPENGYLTYEEACEAGIKYALENFI